MFDVNKFAERWALDIEYDNLLKKEIKKGNVSIKRGQIIIKKDDENTKQFEELLKKVEKYKEKNNGIR